MTVGSRMDFEFDEAEGRAVGSKIGLRGRVLGVPLSVDEVVTARTPPTPEDLGDDRNSQPFCNRSLPDGL
jgi:hypothetical protein